MEHLGLPTPKTCARLIAYKTSPPTPATSARHARGARAATTKLSRAR